MNRKLLKVSFSIGFGLALAATAGVSYAQRGGGRRHTATPPAQETRVIAIPCVEAANMMERMRVWLFTPPAGATQYGLGGLGEGHRVWALLPTCSQPNPDDPRDPCPIDHVEIQLITGSGEIHQTEPQMMSAESTRRVQSFVVPASAEQVRIKLLRHDNTVRYEAAVDAAQLGNFAPPEGQPTHEGFAFELARYPSR